MRSCCGALAAACVITEAMRMLTYIQRRLMLMFIWRACESTCAAPAKDAPTLQMLRLGMGNEGEGGHEHLDDRDAELMQVPLQRSLRNAGHRRAYLAWHELRSSIRKVRTSQRPRRALIGRPRVAPRHSAALRSSREWQRGLCRRRPPLRRRAPSVRSMCQLPAMTSRALLHAAMRLPIN